MMTSEIFLKERSLCLNNLLTSCGELTTLMSKGVYFPVVFAVTIISVTSL